MLLSGRGDTTIRIFELGPSCDKLNHCSDVLVHPFCERALTQFKERFAEREGCDKGSNILQLLRKHLLQLRWFLAAKASVSALLLFFHVSCSCPPRALCAPADHGHDPALRPHDAA